MQAWDMGTTEHREWIAQWWRGGATTRRIVEVLQRANVGEKEARLVAQRLAAAAERLSFITEAIIEEELEMVRAYGATVVNPVVRLFNPSDCSFDAGPCPQCSVFGEDVVHGRARA